MPGGPECCEGLDRVPCDSPGSDGTCMECDGAAFCVACGDGTCGPGENICRCPEDCSTTTECITEGGMGGTMLPDGPDCCPGLTQTDCSEPGPAGTCMTMTDVFCCSYCGDGTCGLGENVCRCPSDC